MDLIKSLKLLRTIDELENVDDLLEEHNESYILCLSELAKHDSDLAEQLEELELAASCLYLNETGFTAKAKKAVQEAGYSYVKATKEDHPFSYYIICDNFSFGISEL